MSAPVPEGPSSGRRAELSTMVMSPPPLAGFGSMFIAAFGRASVCTFVSGDDSGIVLDECFIELKKPASISRVLAFACPGRSEPRTSMSEIIDKPATVRVRMLTVGCRLEKRAAGVLFGVIISRISALSCYIASEIARTRVSREVLFTRNALESRSRT